MPPGSPFTRFSFIPLTILFFISSACSTQQKHRVLKLAHGLDITHPVHLGMVNMAERLEEKSGGQLTIQIYPSGQLGAERECLELLQIGSLAMTKVSSAVLEGFVPKYKVLSLPYIFQDNAHGDRVLDGEIGDELLESGTEFWLRGLTFYDAGMRSFYTKDRPIMDPGDLAGLKIRVMKSPTAVEMIRAMGGSPTPISWGELYTALQQGVVDGAENNLPSFYSSHHYEVCKYYSLNEHTYYPDVLLVSTIIWDQLNKQEQQWLHESARESALYQRKVWARSEKESLEAVAAAGVEILYPPKDPFIATVSSLYTQFEADPVLRDLIRRIREKEQPDTLTITNP